MKNYLPDEMEFCYFKMETGHTCLKLDDNKLIITGPHDDIVEPSMEQWISFWEKLEEIGLWDGKKIMIDAVWPMATVGRLQFPMVMRVWMPMVSIMVLPE